MGSVRCLRMSVGLCVCVFVTNITQKGYNCYGVFSLIFTQFGRPRSVANFSQFFIVPPPTPPEHFTAIRVYILSNVPPTHHNM